MTARKIILDCDPGHDDAVAILLAAGNPAIDLVGITTIGGNQTLDKVTHNARTVDGLMVTEGSQVVVGDTAEGGEVRYEVLCRAHHRRRVTARRAKATLSPEPLPFDPEDF